MSMEQLLAGAAHGVQEAQRAVQILRIAVAQARDDRMTDDELIAALDVYNEFGL